MDFAQLMSILEDGELFFSRADLLGDPYEGTIPKSHYERRNELSEIPNDWAEKFLPKFRKICKKYTYLSCWHINDSESAAMWDQYLDADHGICIKSTVDRFGASIQQNNFDIYSSEVRYIDFSEDRFLRSSEGTIPSSISPFVHKRTNFKHEQEFRAIIHTPTWRNSTGESLITAEDIQEANIESGLDKGKRVPIDRSKLIENIYVSPYADDWVIQLLSKILEDYGIDPNKLDSSPMADDPTY